jgi:hypothetical protein
MLPVALAGGAWLVPGERPPRQKAGAIAALAASAVVAIVMALYGVRREHERIASRSLPLCEHAPVAGVRCLSIGAELAAIPDGTRSDADVAHDLAALGASKCIDQDAFSPFVRRYADARVARPADLQVRARVHEDPPAPDPPAAIEARTRKVAEERLRGYNEALCGSAVTPLPTTDYAYVDCGRGTCPVELVLEGCDAGAACLALKGPPTRYVRNVTTDVELPGGLDAGAGR